MIERTVRDLSCCEYTTTVVVELYRVRCPDCGVKTEQLPQLPSEAPYTKRFEDSLGTACESAAASQVGGDWVFQKVWYAHGFAVPGAMRSAAAETGATADRNR